MKVSAIIPLYNSRAYIAEALDSILAQTRPADEIIVVDDGSTDRVSEILDRYRKRVRLVEQPHSGIAATRNRCLREATGDVIAFQDADDLWPPGRLQRLATALQADPSIDIVAGLVEILDQRRVKPPFRENLETTHRLDSMPSMLVRRRVFARVGYFNESLAVAEDSEFFMRCRHMSIPLRTVDVVSLIYRLHENNSSRDVSRNFSNALDAMRVISVMRRKS